MFITSAENIALKRIGALIDIFFLNLRCRVKLNYFCSDALPCTCMAWAVDSWFLKPSVYRTCLLSEWYCLVNGPNGPTGELAGTPSDYINWLSWQTNSLTICLTFCLTVCLTVGLAMGMAISWFIFRRPGWVSSLKRLVDWLLVDQAGKWLIDTFCNNKSMCFYPFYY